MSINPQRSLPLQSDLSVVSSFFCFDQLGGRGGALVVSDLSLPCKTTVLAIIIILIVRFHSCVSQLITW